MANAVGLLIQTFERQFIVMQREAAYARTVVKDH